jgi:hypothetical protein
MKRGITLTKEWINPDWLTAASGLCVARFTVADAYGRTGYANSIKLLLIR